MRLGFNLDNRRERPRLSAPKCYCLNGWWYCYRDTFYPPDSKEWIEVVW